MRPSDRVIAACVVCLAAIALPGRALESVDVRILGMRNESRADALRTRIEAAAVTSQAIDEEVTDGQDLLGRAVSDYSRVVAILYSEGYFGPQVSITLDGREAAEIDPFDPPDTVRQIVIEARAGDRFQFGDTSVAPRAPGNDGEPLAEGFAPGEIARADLVGEAANAAVQEWREDGHALADIGSQRVVADHRAQSLDVDIVVAPGPQLRFGDVRFAGDSSVSEERLREILEWPQGERYAPDTLSETVGRLRRTGTFTTVSVRADGDPNPDQTLDYALTVVDRKPRGFGVTAEFSTLEGLTAGAFWLHRNIFGGAEELRIDGEIAGLGADQVNLAQDDGTDYSLDLRLTRPATFGADNNVFAFASLSREDEPDFDETAISAGIGISRFFTKNFYGEVSGGLRYSDVDDVFGSRDFFHVVLPALAEWDRRDNPGDATKGLYLAGSVQPFIGIDGSETGMVSELDARTYYTIGAEDQVTLAGRVQLGNVIGATLEGTPPEFLFFSGGGDTVRGQRYQSLGVDQGDDQSGGQSFTAVSLELRSRLTRSLGLVGFYDIGFIGEDSFGEGQNGSHSGAGIGFRYATPIGPLRVDVATPLEGDRDRFSTAEIYIGLGQAF